MNIVYLHAHDAGRFVSPYRPGLPTPNLEALAQRGTLFTNAHCAAPTCSPSRAALLTGQSAHEAGMMGLAHRGFSLAHPERHLASYLREQGYETALSGIQHVLTGSEAKACYGRVFTAKREPDYTKYDQRIAAQAASYLKKKKSKPFFLDCGFWLPHRSFPSAVKGARFDDRALELPPGLEDTPGIREDWLEFLTALQSMDTCAGVVLDALAESEHAGDTLVLFTVDHGIAFPGMKCGLKAAGTGVSLIVDYPGNPSAGARCESLVSQLDLFPTLCDFADLPAPAWLSGTSLRPLLDGSAEKIRESVFSEVTFHASYEAMRSVRTERWNLIRVFDDDLSPVPANIDDSPAKEVIIGAGWLRHPRAEVQLYDLESDPGETRNLAEEPEHAEVLAQLEERLRRWMAETNDPLLDGPVPLPEGAVANPRTHISAEEWIE